MNFIRQFADKKYHIAEVDRPKKPICRKRQFKYLQLSLVDNPPSAMVCQKCQHELMLMNEEKQK